MADTRAVLDKKKQLIIFILSYAGWFACILAGKYDLGLLVLLVPVVFFFVVWRFMRLTKMQVASFVVVALIGTAWDSIALNMGWIVLAKAGSGLAPAWLLSLWLLFGIALPLYDGLIRGRLWLAGILGAFIGPASYRSGAAFETLSFPDKKVFLYYGLFWACFFPLALYIYELSIKKFSDPHPRV